MQKYVTCEEFKELRKDFKEKGLKVVHCHGVFDLLHPGHIFHLQESKSMGDILVVSITAAKYVNKMPGRPYFSDELRIKSLSCLEFVDYVLLSEAVTAMDILDIVQPDYYIKGSEYKVSEDDITQNIDKEVERVRLYGGDVRFTKNDIVFSSTKLLNNNQASLSPKVFEFLKEFSKKYSFKDIKDVIDRMKNIKILVVGDIIIDEYIFCSVQGLISKDRTISGRYQKEEKYLGGSLAVAKHLAGLSDNVTICSMIGNDLGVLDNINTDLIIDNNYQTIIKRRYIEKRGSREEYDKLFSINYLNESDFDRTLFRNRLLNIIKDYDLVVVTDYGHGLIDEDIINILQDNAKYLSVNCQTNSSNYGMNLITKYSKVNSFSLDEKELKLATNNNLKKLFKYLNSDVGWVTHGSNGAIGINTSGTCNVPALTLTVQDTIGAGDAYFALVSLCAYLGVSLEIGTFLGSIAGALISNVLGNSKSVNRIDVLKFASTVMNI